MTMEIFNPRRRKFETWEMRVCKCGNEFQGSSHEVLCPECEHKRMLKNIRQQQAGDDWESIPGGRMRKNHIYSQDR